VHVSAIRLNPLHNFAFLGGKEHEDRPGTRLLSLPSSIFSGAGPLSLHRRKESKRENEIAFTSFPSLPPDFIWDQKEKEKKGGNGQRERFQVRSKQEKKERNWRRKLVLLHFIPAQLTFLSLLFSFFTALFLFFCSFTVIICCGYCYLLSQLLTISIYFLPLRTRLTLLPSPSLSLRDATFIDFRVPDPLSFLTTPYTSFPSFCHHL